MRAIHLTLLAALAVSSASRAADWALCPPQPALPSTDVAAPGGPGITRAAAESATVRGPLTVLEGNVGIRRDGRSIGASRVELHRPSSRAQASGDVFFTTPDYAVFGDQGALHLDSGALSIEAARYRLPGIHTQGRASRIERDAAGVSRLSEATWSTCPADAEAWHLAGERVTLDPNTRQGTARNVTLWFQGVPLFYAPWFRFPLGDQRMTGFLAPRVGRSSRSGTEIAVPWYWNIAPHLDATLTPRWLADRGAQLQSEWRWLGPLGYWELDHAYLPDDELAGIDRRYARVQQRARAGAWHTDIDAAEVSDPEYFEDLGDAIELSSQTHLAQRADLTWQGRRSWFRARVQAFQTIDESIAPASRPYEQLPRLQYAHGADLGPLDTRLETELVRFDRDVGDIGERLRVVPSAGWPVEAPGWFLRPRLTIDHTRYDLERRASSGPEAPSRTLPIASLDAGLIFDRFGERFQQTLEPRLFAVHVPREDQDDIPVFDSGRYGFSFAQLFRERRFTGGDRVGDAQRVSLALTSRLLERASGREVLRGSIGGIRYLEDREVTLPSGAPEEPLDDDTSDLIVELAASPTRAWSGDLTLQWDPDTDDYDRGDLGVRYRGGGGRVLNLGYRYERDRQDEVDLSAAWPLSTRWSGVARSNWSLEDERNIEALAGLAYEDCCWRFRAVARQFLNASDASADGTEQSRSLYFELTLKGLGPVGDPAGRLLERAILGYRNPDD